MAEIMKVLKEFFTDDEWPYQLMEDPQVVRTGFRGDNGQWVCFVRVIEELDRLVFYSVLPVHASEEKLGIMAEFVTRANFGLLIGNFEMDYTDGELRYKTSVDVEGNKIGIAMVRNLAYANVLTVDDYLPGIMNVLFSEMTPEEAVARIEAVDEEATVAGDNEEVIKQVEKKEEKPKNNSGPKKQTVAKKATTTKKKIATPKKDN